jgi:hypothetical protein
LEELQKEIAIANARQEEEQRKAALQNAPVKIQINSLPSLERESSHLAPEYHSFREVNELHTIGMDGSHTLSIQTESEEQRDEFDDAATRCFHVSCYVQ